MIFALCYRSIVLLLLSLQELEKLRAEKKEMAKDMKKMMRQHIKLQAKMSEMDPNLPKLLEMIAVIVSF